MTEKKNKRVYTFSVRLSLDELEEVRRKAEVLGISVSDYGRARILGFSDKFIWKDGDIIFFNKDDAK